MNEETLTPYLKQILAGIQEHTTGIPVDAELGEPDAAAVVMLAELTGEDPEDVRNAILGLRACECLMEETVQFEGIEDWVDWTVHPQCRGVS